MTQQRWWTARIPALSLAILLCQLFPARSQEREPLPRFAPLEPPQALKVFKVQRGFRVDLLAAEPLVMDPVAGAYDEQGRLWVVEMSDYPHVESRNDQPFAENLGDPPVGRVRVLLDRDNDGVFDTSSIFADKLSWPTGIAVWKGGVFVAATPDIWYLKDTDVDGKADIRQRVFTGFRKFNVQAVINNLQWGPDHKIYGAGSSNGGNIRPGDADNAKAVALLRRDFRFDPETLAFEPISGGARFGNTFNDWSDRFLCDIRNPAQHVVLPGRYLARNPYLPAPRALFDSAEGGDGIPLFRVSPAEPWRELRARRWSSIGKALPRSELVGAGFLTSSSGITAYRGDAYPDDFRGNLFLGEVANNLVHRMNVIPDGVTFRARRADPGVEFLTSTDTWFRPVNFVNAPDGTLHLLDMYRETIEHPWSIPDDIRARLDLRSGEDRGRIYRITPPDFRRRATPNLATSNIATLVELLEHSNGWHRETAQRLIFERQDRAAVKPLRAILRDGRSEQGRFLALHSLDGLKTLDLDDILAALRDPSEHVRESAVALAESRLAKSPRLISELARLADDPSVRVRFQVAFSLGEATGPEVTRGLRAIASRDAADPWVRTAVLSSATVDPAGLFVSLWSDREFAHQPDSAPLLDALAVVLGARGKRDEVRLAIAALASRPDGLVALHVINGLANGLTRSRQRLGTLRDELAPASVAWLDDLWAKADKLALDASTPLATRTGAIEFLGHDRFEAQAGTLRALLAPEQPTTIQGASARALTSFDRPEAVGWVVQGWKSYSPALRNEVVGLLLARRVGIMPVLDAVQTGLIPATQVPAARRALLLKDADPDVRKKAAQLLGESPGSRREAVDRYRPFVEKAGDAARGRQVFERECASCHQLGKTGHPVGPNLAGVRRRTSEEILVNILDPNREVSPEYLEYTVALDDGRVVTGLVASETPAAITLRAREGVEQTILRRNIQELAGTGKSLMPEGLEKTITPQAMADVIAYLLKIQDE